MYKFLGILLFFSISGCLDSSSSSPLEKKSAQEVFQDQSILTPSGENLFDKSSTRYLVSSPEGRHAYFNIKGGAYQGNRIGLFSWDESTKEYLFVDTVIEHVLAQEAEISQDGQYIYAPIQGEQTINTYKRNVDTGSLTLQQSIDLSKILPHSNFWPDAVRINPNNNFIYVKSSQETLAIFSIEDNGDISFVQETYISSSGFGDYEIDHTGMYMYMFEKRDLLSVYELSNTDGSLLLSSSIDLTNPLNDEILSVDFSASQSDIIPHPTKSEILISSQVYVKSYDGSFSKKADAILSFRINSQAEVSLVSSKILDWNEYPGSNCFLTINTDGSKIYLGKRFKDNRTTLNIYPISKLLSFSYSNNAEISYSSTLVLENLEDHLSVEPNFITNKNVIIANAKYNNSISIQVNLDQSGDPISNSELRHHSSEIHGLGAVTQILKNPNGNIIYTLTGNDYSSPGDYSLLRFEYDDNDQKLTKSSQIRFHSINEYSLEDRVSSTYNYHADLNFSPNSIVTTPNGEYIYTIGHRSILGFHEDFDSNNFNPIRFNGIHAIHPPSSSYTYYNSAISPDGDYMYITAVENRQSEGKPAKILKYSIDHSNGNLTLTTEVELPLDHTGVNFTRATPFIKINRSGRNLYYFDRAFAILIQFNIDLTNGTLSNPTFIQDGDIDLNGNILAGLIESTSAVFSRDQSYIYVSSDEIYNGGFSPFTGLPTNETSINVLHLNSMTNKFSIVQSIKRNSTDNAGRELTTDIIQGGYESLNISQDGNYLFGIKRAISNIRKPIFGNNIAIDVFEIERNTGKLSLIQSLSENFHGLGVSGLAQLPNINKIISTNERTNSISTLDLLNE